MEASAKDGEGAGRGPCGLRNSELGPRPHDVHLAFKKDFWSMRPFPIDKKSMRRIQNLYENPSLRGIFYCGNRFLFYLSSSRLVLPALPALSHVEKSVVEVRRGVDKRCV